MQKINSENIKEILKIISFKSKIYYEKSDYKFSKLLYIWGLILIFISICVALFYKYQSPIEELRLIFNILFISALFSFGFSPIIMLIKEKKILKEIFQNPQKSLIEPLQAETDDLIPIINELSRYKELELDYVVDRIQIKLENTEKRIGHLIGQIDKVGLFPTILAMLVLAIKPDFFDVSSQNWITNSVLILIVIVILFNFLGMYMHDQTEELKLKVKILRFSIKLNQKNIEYPIDTQKPLSHSIISRIHYYFKK